MKTAILQRLETSNQGTFGKLYFGSSSVFSGELMWRNNAANISCIPEDTYICQWTYSPHFKRNMYLISNVPRRSGIRIHSANYMGNKDEGLRCHLYGCLALSLRLGTIQGQKALITSRPAITRLDQWGNGETFKLEVHDGYS